MITTYYYFQRIYLVWDPSIVYLGCFHILGVMNGCGSLVPQLGFDHKGGKYRQVRRIASTGIQQLQTIQEHYFLKAESHSERGIYVRKLYICTGII